MVRSIFLFALSGIALTFSQLCADRIVIEDVMTREEQRETGFDTLSQHQKIQLEAWVNRTFVLKNTPAEKESQLYLSINIENGQKLQLSDNSVWEISPDDVSQAAIWVTSFPVKIVPSNNPKYPSLIVNTNSGASVKARKLPASTQPSTMTK